MLQESSHKTSGPGRNTYLKNDGKDSTLNILHSMDSREMLLFKNMICFAGIFVDPMFFIESSR